MAYIAQAWQFELHRDLSNKFTDFKKYPKKSHLLNNDNASEASSRDFLLNYWQTEIEKSSQENDIRELETRKIWSNIQKLYNNPKLQKWDYFEESFKHFTKLFFWGKQLNKNLLTSKTRVEKWLQTLVLNSNGNEKYAQLNTPKVHKAVTLQSIPI